MERYTGHGLSLLQVKSEQGLFKSNHHDKANANSIFEISLFAECAISGIIVIKGFLITKPIGALLITQQILYDS